MRTKIATITIKNGSSESYTLTGRAAEFVEWLAERAELIAGVEQGQIQFDYAGPTWTGRNTEITKRRGDKR